MEDANDLERPGVGSVNDEAGTNDKEAMPVVNPMFAAATRARNSRFQFLTGLQHTPDLL